MSIFKCKMCGGSLQAAEGSTVAVCEYCGTRQTLPRLADEKRANLYDRAGHFRRNNEFDKAAAIYEKILTEDTADAEAYWSLVLCRYGIEYVEDPATHRRLPTVNRAQYTSVFDDDNYQSALRYADASQREVYQTEAAAINEIQKSILAISQNEAPFDVFICYKETDQNGRRTPDSVLATELYHQLVQVGYNVFFSRITLEDKLGTAYEPYIFAALNSAKVMVVLGTRAEYFNAVWVKNEWSRYLALIRAGGQKMLIPAYRDMDPYDLPEEFSHLQAQDMSKLGFMQDLIRGIQKLVPMNTPAATVTPEAVPPTATIANLLKRVEIFLEDGQWARADDFCEQVLNQDPENGEAYLGKLLAELQVSDRGQLGQLSVPFTESSNYMRVQRYASPEVKAELEKAIAEIHQRNHLAQMERIYQEALSMMQEAKYAGDYHYISEQFASISGYKDADALSEQCIEEAKAVFESEQMADMYEEACYEQEIDGESSLRRALELFYGMRGYKDVDERIAFCEEHIVDVAKAEKRARWIAAIFLILVTVLVVVTILWVKVVGPSLQYKKAHELMDNGEYYEAYTHFQDLGSYKDSSHMMGECVEERVDSLLDDQLDAMRNASVGDTVTFGIYEQDMGDSYNRSGDIDEGNWLEDIEWIVLEKQEDKVFLISRQILDYQPYDDYNSGWSESKLYSWLDTVFLPRAFLGDAYDRLVYAPSILSSQEVEQYFKTVEGRTATMTEYVTREYYVNPGNDETWWLRGADAVDTYGEIHYAISSMDEERGVRPVIWVDVSK